MYGHAPASMVTGVPGWETQAEESRLMALAGQVPAGGLIVEIGAEYGMSTAALCKAAREKVRIVSIDLFPGAGMYYHSENLKAAGFEGRFEQIRGDSIEVGRAWNTPIDLLFLDGDHHYTGVKADIEAWLPHVKPGGYALFHDCACKTNPQPHPQHFEVQRAVNEWFFVYGNYWIEHPSVDTMRVFERAK